MAKCMVIVATLRIIYCLYLISKIQTMHHLFPWVNCIMILLYPEKEMENSSEIAVLLYFPDLSSSLSPALFTITKAHYPLCILDCYR